MYKTVIVVWSEDKPDQHMDITEAAEWVHDGTAFCASIKTKRVVDLADDLDMTDEVAEFFNLDEDGLPDDDGDDLTDVDDE